MQRGGGWVEVSRSEPCAKCGRPDFCTRSADGVVTKCMRDSGGRQIKQRDGSFAYLYRTAELGSPVVSRKAKAQSPRLNKADLRQMVRRHQADLTDRKLEIWSRDLGLSVKAMRAYGVGIDPQTQWASFPMYDGTRDGKGNPNPCGIRLRNPQGGKKLCVPGSRNGIFLPAGYDPREIPAELCDDGSPLLVLMPEGPTDCCAAFDLGFPAVGRPSNSGGADQVRAALAWNGIRQDVVIVADRDETKYQPDGTPFWPGHEGALALADGIVACCARLRLVKPPKGSKDLRQWLRDGGTAGMWAAVIGAADVIDAAWLKAKRLEVYEWKRRLRRAPERVA